MKNHHSEILVKLRNFKPSGFTLIEILVVLVVIGVTLGVVAVNFAPDARQQLQQEGHRLALLMSHASNLARTSGQAIAWQANKEGYTFKQRNAEQNEWQVMSADNSLHPRTLPDSMRISRVKIAGKAAQLDEMIIFSPSGINPAFDLTLASSEARLSVTGDILGKVLDLPASEANQ